MSLRPPLPKRPLTQQPGANLKWAPVWPQKSRTSRIAPREKKAVERVQLAFLRVRPSPSHWLRWRRASEMLNNSLCRLLSCCHRNSRNKLRCRVNRTIITWGRLREWAALAKSARYVSIRLSYSTITRRMVRRLEFQALLTVTVIRPNT